MPFSDNTPRNEESFFDVVFLKKDFGSVRIKGESAPAGDSKMIRTSKDRGW